MIQWAMTPAPTLVEHWLEDIRLADPERHALVERLRRMVLKAHPAVREELKYGGILFSAGAPVCGIFSYDSHVSLEFGRGAEMLDKHHALEGEGKMRRHIKILSGNDLFKKNIGEYLAMAFGAVGGGKARQVPSAGKAPPRG